MFTSRHAKYPAEAASGTSGTSGIRRLSRRSETKKQGAEGGQEGMVVSGGLVVVCEVIQDALPGISGGMLCNDVGHAVVSPCPGLDALCSSIMPRGCSQRRQISR